MSFWEHFAELPPGATEIAPSFDYSLGWLAGVLAVIGAFALFPSLNRMRDARSAGVRLLWLLSGAMVIGTGFWAMQWMAMLGFSVPNTPIRYQLGEMGFAALFAIAGSAVAIVVLNRPKAGIL
ncbi:MAG: hypothetical protein L6Q83_11850, partial [Gammaproteobacteria bacterium]|nr:hypothetical protein [Gammaproteobacteria bacterium]